MKSIFTILAAVFLIHNVYSQKDKESIDRIVNEIKTNTSNYEKIIELDDSSGFKYVYKQNKELQYIVLSYNDDNINKNVEWYFKDNKFIYGEVLWIKDKMIISNKNSVYLHNERLIYWIKDDVAIENSTADFKEYNKELKNYVKKMKSRYI